MNYFQAPLSALLIIGGLVFNSPKVLARASADSTDSTAKAKPVRSISSQEHINEFSFWGGLAFDSFRFWGKTPDATMQSLGLRYSRKFLHFYRTEVEYFLQVNAYSKYSYPEFKPGRPRNSITGFGITPLGFQMNFRSDETVQPFLNSAGGFMLLEAPFPDSRGKKFNFTLSIGGGLEFMLSQSVSLSLGIQYHHLSNGYLGEVNPGIDSSFFYSAITIF